MKNALKILGIVVGALVVIIVLGAIVGSCLESPSVTQESGYPNDTQEGTNTPTIGKGLTLLEHHLSSTSTDYAQVEGRVQNTGHSTLTDVKVLVKWFDKEGDVRGEDYDYSDCEIKPGEVFQFEIICWDLKYDEVGRYEITAKESWI